MDIDCCNFFEHKIELKESAVPHREGARRMTPHKSDACRAEIEKLLEYDMIKPSKSPWACGVVMAKKKGVAKILLRLLLPERGDHKGHLPNTTHRREPLEAWRCQFFHYTRSGFSLPAGSTAKEGQRKYWTCI